MNSGGILEGLRGFQMGFEGFMKLTQKFVELLHRTYLIFLHRSLQEVSGVFQEAHVVSRTFWGVSGVFRCDLGDL